MTFKSGEVLDVLDLLLRLRADGVKAALARVIRLDGSGYRRPGAWMALASDGRSAGVLSGGCLEADLRERALEVVATGWPMRLRYGAPPGLAEPPWGVERGCGGRVEIFLQALERFDWVDSLRRLLDGGRAARVVTVIDAPPSAARRAGHVVVEPIRARGGRRPARGPLCSASLGRLRGS